jgi:hypothetical protein
MIPSTTFAKSIATSISASTTAAAPTTARGTFVAAATTARITAEEATGSSDAVPTDAAHA